MRARAWRRGCFRRHPTQGQKAPKARDEKEDKEDTVRCIVDAGVAGTEHSTEKHGSEHCESKPHHRSETSVKPPLVHASPIAVGFGRHLGRMIRYFIRSVNTP